MAAAGCSGDSGTWRAVGHFTTPLWMVSPCLATSWTLLPHSQRIERILWPNWLSSLSWMGKPRNRFRVEARDCFVECSWGPISPPLPNWCHPAEARSLWSPPDSQVVGFIRTTQQSPLIGTNEGRHVAGIPHTEQ